MPLPDVPVGLERKANEQIDTFLVMLRAAQDDYHAVYGTYLQLLPSHMVPPKGGQETAPDALQRKPSDRLHAWDRVGAPVKSLVALSVNYYGGPLGDGYELVSQIRVADRLWQRRLNAGPETWRAHDWQDVTPGLEVVSIGVRAQVEAHRLWDRLRQWLQRLYDALGDLEG